MRKGILVSLSIAAALASAVVISARQADPAAHGAFAFTPLPASAACVPGGAGGCFPEEQPFMLPAGFTQIVIARQGDGGSIDNWDMNTVNESGSTCGPLSIPYG